MKAKFYARLVMVCASFFLFIGISAQQTHLEIPIVDGNDDAEESSIETEWFPEGGVTRVSSDLELYWDDAIQYIGVLFRDVQIPQGTTVDSAYIQFVCKNAGADEILIHIWGVDSVKVDSILEVNYGVSGNEPTTATVDWSPDPWIVEYDAKPEQRTPHLNTIIDEIVAKEGWVSGNNMMFVLTGDVDENKIRQAYSYDMDQFGPVLNVWFSDATGNQIHQRTDFRSLVYPNPAEGNLYILNPSSDRFSYNIFNINGKLVASEQHISGSGIDVNLSNLSKGVYFVKLITTEQAETHKVILK